VCIGAVMKTPARKEWCALKGDVWLGATPALLAPRVPFAGRATSAWLFARIRHIAVEKQFAPMACARHGAEARHLVAVTRFARRADAWPNVPVRASVALELSASTGFVCLTVRMGDAAVGATGDLVVVATAAREEVSEVSEVVGTEDRAVVRIPVATAVVAAMGALVAMVVQATVVLAVQEPLVVLAVREPLVVLVVLVVLVARPESVRHQHNAQKLAIHALNALAFPQNAGPNPLRQVCPPPNRSLETAKSTNATVREILSLRPTTITDRWTPNAPSALALAAPRASPPNPPGQHASRQKSATLLERASSATPTRTVEPTRSVLRTSAQAISAPSASRWREQRSRKPTKPAETVRKCSAIVLVSHIRWTKTRMFLPATATRARPPHALLESLPSRLLHPARYAGQT